jgi:hypothetical protein
MRKPAKKTIAIIVVLGCIVASGVVLIALIANTDDNISKKSAPTAQAQETEVTKDAVDVPDITEDNTEEETGTSSEAISPDPDKEVHITLEF